MSRKKKKRSTTLDKAQVRLAALKSIDANLNVGHGLTARAYANLISRTRRKLERYNTTLSLLDKLQIELIELERSLADMTERMLTGVATKFGKSSTEYEMAGGTRRPERRRRQSPEPEPEAPPETPPEAAPALATG